MKLDIIPLWAKIGIPIALAALACLAFQWWLSDVKDDARQEGVTQERVGNLEQVIERTERADNAAETIRRDPVARNAECLRRSRTPENC